MRLHYASKSEILKWSKKYKPDEKIDKLEKKLIEMKPTVKQRRYLNKDQLKILVLCQSLLEGYNFLSLMRASWVVNRQWTVEHC